MTNIIKNIYTCNFCQSIFTRFLGTVILAFILLIGGSGSAWAQTVVATWDWKTNSQIDGFSTVEGNTCTIASDQTGVSLDIDATSGKVWDNGDNIGVNSGTIISVPVQSVNDVVVVRNYSGYTNYQVGEQGPANDLVIHFVTSDEAEAGKVDITVTSQVYLYTIMVAQNTVSNGSYTAAWNWNQASNVISGSLSKTVQGNVDFEESDVAGVALTIDATASGAKVQYGNNGIGYIQFNTGTVIYVPVKCAGDKITINAYSDQAGYKIGDGEPVAYNANVVDYIATTADARNGYVKIIATSDKYLCGITLKHFQFKDFALNMYNGSPFFTNTPTSNPYYVTVNESGVASYATTEPAFYNAKMTFDGYNGDQHGYTNMVANIPVVPGKYDITIGNCTSAGPYLVKNGETVLETINANSNCYAGTTETATKKRITIDSPMTLTIINNGSQATYTPYFAISKVDESGRALDVTITPTGAGTVTGVGNYAAGANVTLTATANRGYSFVKWTDASDNEVSTSSSYDLTMPDADVNYKAVFEALTPYSISFSMGSETGVEGSLPSTVNNYEGETWTVPANHTLYKEGYTLDGWSDGNTTYHAGDVISTTKSLTPVFTANTKSLADRTSAVTVTWDFQRGNGAPNIALEGTGATGIFVTQANVGGTTIDCKLDIDATAGKLNNVSWTDWAQVNNGTKFTVPSCENATITAYVNNNATATTIAGEIPAMSGKIASVTTSSANLSQQIVASSDIGYMKYITVVYPIISADERTAKWDWKNGAPSTITSVSIENTTGEVASNIDGVSLYVDATNSGKLASRTSDAQFNSGTEIQVPVRHEGDIVTVKSYPSYHFYTVAGVAASADETNYTATASDATKGYVSIIATSTAYLYSISVKQIAYSEAPEKSYVPDEPTEIIDVPTGIYDFIVSNVDELKAALAVEGTSSDRNTIFVMDGTYDLGTAYNTQVKDYTTIVGQSRDGVIIKNSPVHEGIWYSATLRTKSNVILQNLTLQCNVTKGSSVGFDASSTVDDQRGTALYDEGSNNVYKNIRLLGRQDTYYSDNNATSYLEGCEIHGAVDFICGSGNVWFEKCALLIESSTVAYITAARKYSTPGTYNGYIFNECTIDNAEGADMAGKYYLGRAWDANAKVSYYKTTKEIAPNAEKWTAMAGGAHVVSVDVDNSPANVVASPVSYLPAPVGISVQNGIITWPSVDGASAYAVFDGNNIIAIVGSDVLSYDTTSPFTAKSVAGYNSFGTEDRYSVAAIGADGLIGNLVTDKEIASLGSEFYYDFRDQDFDFDDHELIDRIGDNSEYHDNQHGWKFNADSGFSVEVAGNATIYVSRCTFGSGSPIFTITSDNGGTISPNTFDARSDYAGEMAVINYIGPATTLRFVTDGESYVHTVRVVNEGAVAVAFAETKDKATIKNNVIGATVYYTLDGSTPTTTNYKERFTGAYSVVPVKDCWVKAISVKDGVVIDMEEKFCRSTLAGFSWDFSNGSTLLGNYGQNNKFETGVIIDDRGDTHLVPVGDMSSSIDISTAYHDASHGYVGFHARVPVEGPVTITIGNCQYGNGKVTISAENGQKWDLYPSEAGNCYHENKESNFVRFEYTGDATILTIASENNKTVYLPYISVRDASASKVKFVNRYPKTLLGTAPNEVEVNEAHQAFIPYNTTLYREGWAVTGWEDSETGTKYDLGRNYTFYQNTTLYPVLTKCTKAITDTDHELTVTWPFDKLDGAPTIKLHDYTSDPLTMTYVKGVNVEGAMVDVPLVIDATSSKAVNTDERVNDLSGNGAQFNDNTVLRIPAVYGMTVTLNASDKNDGLYHTSTSFTGDNHAVVKLCEEDATVLSNQGTVTNNGKTITFTYEGDSPTLDIFVEKAGSGATWGFFTDLSVTYPVLPNVVTTNVITNADAETYPNENPENAGEVTVTLTSEGASHVNTGSRFREGDVVTLEATPGYGYTFAGFRKRVEGGDPVTISGNEFTVPEEGGITTIEVLFTRKDLVKVTATSDDITKGDVSLTPKYKNLYNELENGVEAYFEAGTEVSVSAEAEREYVIEKWIDGATEIVGRNTYSFTLTSEKNIVAHFKPGAMGTVVFNIEGSGVHNVPDPDTFNNAVSIAPETQSGVRSFYIPNNYTFFKNQYTLMYWTDGTRRYELGKYYSFDYEGQEIVLTPVFEHNIADKENRVRGDELYWDFLTMNNVQKIHWDTPNLNFFWTSKVDVEVIEDGIRRDHTRDVALWIHTNSDGFMRNDDMPDWAAFGPGTTIDLPSCAGATIKIYSYSEITSTTIDGHIPVLDELETRKIHEDGEHGYVYTYVTSNPNPRVTIAIGDDFSYYKWIRCYSLPAALMELHMDVDNSVRGEIVEIKGSGEYEATELADGGFAFQQGNRVHATFKRKFGYDFDRIIDVNRFTETGDPLPVIQVQRTDGVITGVRMVMKNSDEFEDAVKQPDGSWLGSAFTFTEMPVTEGELDTYELQFEISSHRTIEVCFLPRPTHYITFSTGEFASGVAPEPLWVEEGDKFTIPYNKTLYYDNHTLKAWRDENNNMYSLGGEYRAPATDLRLYPVFVENIFSVLDITEDTKVTWNLTKNGGAPTISYERSAGILVTQLWKDDDFIDMKIDLNASELYKDGALWVVNGNVVAGKFDNTSYDDRCQINEHSTITFPAIKDCVIELEALSPIPTSVKISGSEHAEAAKISHTYVLGWTQHSVEFEDDGNNGNVYNTWCTALSITYKPITANMPELASVTYGSTTLTAAQLASLKQNLEIDVPFNVGENDEFPNVTATAENGKISVAQANIDNHTAIVYLVSYGGITIDSYNLNFIPVIETSPMLVGSPSIYVNSTGYNSEVIPLDQPINGTISLSFSRTMKAVESSTGIRLYNEGVAQGDALTALQGPTLVLRYWDLEVNKEYTLTIPANTLQDVFGGMYDSDISVTFRTASEIVPIEHRKFNWIVGVDGTLSEGINAANNTSGLGRFYIFVPDGEYELEGNETIVPSTSEDATTLYDGDGVKRNDLLGTTLDNNKTRISRANVSLIGQSENGTRIFNRPVIEGIGYTATLHLPASATDFYAQDLTLENRFNYRKSMSASQNNAARAVVLQDHASRSILKNVSMWSYQDTYYTSNSETDPHFSAYLEDCSIAGVVDWVSGGGNVWFERCNLIHRDRAGNNIAAPHTNANQRWGYVFNDCLITTESDPESMQEMGDKDWTLARPWGVAPNQSPACTFINTTVNVLPRDAGWGAMYGGMILRFHEYKTKDAYGNLVSLANRSLAACAPAAGSDDYLLSNAEAAEYEVNEVLEFDPSLYTTQREAVTNISIEGGVLKWNANADGMDLCYFIFKKDSEGKWKYFANVADTNLDFSLYGEDMREGIYMIRAANQRGGLGAYSEEIEYKEAEMYELIIAEIGQTPGKGWSTICLPNNARVPEGDIKVYAAVSIDGNIVTLKSVDYITANIGYVVYGAADTYVFYGSTHKATDTEGYNYSHDSYLSGNPSGQRESAAATNCYTLAYKPTVSGIGFYRYSGAWLNPHKAYLEIDVFKQFNSSTADENDMLSKSFAKGIRFVFAPEENTTDIPLLDLNAIVNYKTDAIYDLSGRRVVTPHSGQVYIINGSKAVRK